MAHILIAGSDPEIAPRIHCAGSTYFGHRSTICPAPEFVLEELAKRDYDLVAISPMEGISISGLVDTVRDAYDGPILVVDYADPHVGEEYCRPVRHRLCHHMKKLMER